jgi:peptide/nickel transport system permease protein
VTRVLGRVAWSLLVLWFVVTTTFALAFAIPADPARALVGPHADAATVERVRSELCLDRPFWVAYGCHVGRIMHGDLGTSFRLGRPVAAILWERTGPTVELAVAAVVLQLGLGVALGAVAAMRKDRAADLVTSVLALLGQSAPTFFLGPLFMYLLAYGLGLFPISGHGAPGLDRLWHLALPALTLAFAGVASYTRLVRAELIEVLGADYIRTARAKGAAPSTILIRHALRNALLPVVTYAGIDLGVLLGGAVVTEAVFAWPGLGREAVLAILNVDLPVVLGVTLVAAVAVLVTSLVVDVLVAAIDPRARS